MLTKQFRELNRQADVLEKHKAMKVKASTVEVFTDTDILKFLNKIYKTSNRYKLTIEEIKTLKNISDRL
jgi:uncharacterized radical SAM superfamily protein